MSEFKIQEGDRVKVAAFESIVDYVNRQGDLVDVSYGSESFTIPVALCTVIPEPLKIGDIVTDHNRADIPAGAVLRSATAKTRPNDMFIVYPNGKMRGGSGDYMKTLDTSFNGYVVVLLPA